VSNCQSNKCSNPIKIDFPINSDNSDIDPFIDPNGTSVIYASNRDGGYGGYDQYISFNNNDGTWSSLKNLGAKFNTQHDNSDMDVSPDGKYLFIYLNGDIYWMQSGDLMINRLN
jgi:hypothetical protein